MIERLLLQPHFHGNALQVLRAERQSLLQSVGRLIQTLVQYLNDVAAYKEQSCRWDAKSMELEQLLDLPGPLSL